MGKDVAHLVGKVEACLGTADRHDDWQVSILTGYVQRCVAMAILLVHIALVSQEAADHFNLTPPYSQVEGCVAILGTAHSKTQVQVFYQTLTHRGD